MLDRPTTSSLTCAALVTALALHVGCSGSSESPDGSSVMDAHDDLRSSLDSTSSPDVSVDPAPDASLDASMLDAVIDAPQSAPDAAALDAFDATPDSRSDALPDAPPDSRPDSQADAQPDVQPDAQPDARADATADAMPDAGRVDWTRPIAPMSTATTTTTRPTFRWVVGAGDVSPTSVLLCRDPGLSMGCQSIAPTGSSARPASALAAGVWFWQLVGTSRAGRAPIWRVEVPRLNTAVDSSFSTAFDVDRDGFADLAAGVEGANAGAGRVDTFRGAAMRPSRTSVRIASPYSTDAAFGYTVTGAGDINGDGFADLLVHAPSARPSAQLHVFFGSSTGLPALSSQVLDPPTGNAFGLRSSFAGDVNGDGYSDVLVQLSGRVAVYLGSAAGLPSTPSQLIAAPMSLDLFGDSLGTAGDVNGDGRSDVIIGAPQSDSSAGRAYVYLGAASGLNLASVVSIAGSSGDGLGKHVASVGDVNGDGYGDVAIGTGYRAPSNTVRVFLGRAAGISTSPVQSLRMTTSFWLGGVAYGGDVTGDGYSDIVVYGDGGPTLGRRMDVYAGGASGPTLLSQGGWSDSTPGNAPLTGAIARLGDINADGRDDLAFSAIGYIYTENGRRADALTFSLFIVGALPSPDGSASGFTDSLALRIDRAMSARSRPVCRR